ncbi:hypothetical protein NC653_038566 [Populus alba x Populus x berolinensis]|uniref:RNase H type-1 domain-containing protein n=1 Tax=Populus alba x Populus x berolinensis TaxID=444605 RepID=A0AAD6LH77_9ROSI|nr:hypothetical protein NC653_038566 [Populus alba x Populus x berolinensis]
MNGIIDTEEDVKLLREKGIILNRLKSDAEVASLWNGMSKSIRLTKVPFLDKVIEDVNRYYNGRWTVKGGRFMKQYVFSSWQFLTLLAAIFLLLLMTLQVFCTVYRYTRMLHMRPPRNYPPGGLEVLDSRMVRAELCPVVPGLESAWMLGFLKVILESESKLVVQLIMQVSTTVEANYSLIAKPTELQDREWKIKVQCVYREANQATDWLANFSSSMNYLDRSN